MALRIAVVGERASGETRVAATPETVKKFKILPRDLSVDDGELTPSMKVRRPIVEKKYADVLAGFYAD